jgi:hypothetical protein
VGELLGVSHQRARSPTSRPSHSGRPPASEPLVGSTRGRGVGEGLAVREALALTEANGHLERSAVIRVEARLTLEGPKRPRPRSTTAWLPVADGTAAVYRWRYGHRR